MISYSLAIELILDKMVPEVRVELTCHKATVFETAASAIPPLGHVS